MYSWSIRWTWWKSLGMTVTRLACIAAIWLFSKIFTAWASTASWIAPRASTDHRNGSFVTVWVISRTNLDSASLEIRRSVLICIFRISLNAPSPGFKGLRCLRVPVWAFLLRLLPCLLTRGTRALRGLFPFPVPVLVWSTLLAALFSSGVSPYPPRCADPGPNPAAGRFTGKVSFRLEFLEFFSLPAASLEVFTIAVVSLLRRVAVALRRVAVALRLLLVVAVFCCCGCIL